MKRNSQESKMEASRKGNIELYEEGMNNGTKEYTRMIRRKEI